MTNILRHICTIMISLLEERVDLLNIFSIQNDDATKTDVSTFNRLCEVKHKSGLKDEGSII